MRLCPQALAQSLGYEPGKHRGRVRHEMRSGSASSRSERSIQRAATLGDDLAAIVGTSLDEFDE